MVGVLPWRTSITVVGVGADFLEVDFRVVFVAIAPFNLLSIGMGRHADRPKKAAGPPRRQLAALEADVIGCRACPRLVGWREQVAREKRAAFRDEEYWGRPIPGFGDPDARIVVLGLAPAAHGANRTGRVFTGDRSGDWLFRAMHRAGLANQPTSVSIDDGLELTDAWVTAAVKCAPPGNQPLPAERDACEPFLTREFAGLVNARVVVCLGGFGFAAACRHFGVRPRPKFGHGVEIDLAERPETGLQARGPILLCSFHPSQQNTYTGRLTEPMLDEIFTRAVDLAARPFRSVGP